jgi:hypothetical protein
MKKVPNVTFMVPNLKDRLVGGGGQTQKLSVLYKHNSRTLRTSF